MPVNKKEIKMEKNDIQQVNCDFKGVWISKEIWLDKNLSLTEKLFLAEIYSLSDNIGCYANNEHFSKYSGLSKNRCSEIITSLAKKNYITTELIYEGMVFIHRIIRIIS